MTRPLLRGVIKTWKVDRGFGFISPENGGRDVFIHISAIGKTGRLPEPGDIVNYQLVRDKHGKFRAINASFEGVQSKNKKIETGSNIRRSWFWPIAIAASLLMTLAGGAYLYLKSRGLADSLF